MRFPLVLCWALFTLALLPGRNLHAHVAPAVPAEMASHHFEITVEGERSPAMHAAENLYFLNFEARPKHRITISVSADRDDFWARGVEVQPWRLGIRPHREGRTISFTIDGPVKLSISRPNDFLGAAEMLYLFANAPEKDPPVRSAIGLQYIGPGVHHENIEAVSGGSIYLAPGAVVFGSLNVWGVENVKVFGRGIIVYDGPQNPADDDGWMHKRNWHCIVMDQAHHISIEGITCVVRSRTWQIQMKDSRDIRFDNLKVIGANAGNANADGMDWLGGGDTVIKDSFFRAADDIFAMQGSWEGYGAAAFAVNGNPVTNIRVEDSVLSTSISNIVRAGWPEKNFEGGHFLMRNTDVLHMGLGGCGIPFALMEIWADPNGRGHSEDFVFEDIRLEDWYSLTQLMEPVDGIATVRFTDVFGLELPSLIPSTVKGSVSGVTFDNVALGGTPATTDTSTPIDVLDGEEGPRYKADGPGATILLERSVVAAGRSIHLEARPPLGVSTKDWTYRWSFGDGTYATGRRVKHSFPDSNGTLLNGDGRFRILLSISDKAGRHGWAYEPLLVADALKPAVPITPTEPGLVYQTYTLEHPSLDDMLPGAAASAQGIAPRLAVTDLRPRPEDYAAAFTGFITAPQDGAYSLTLLANDAGRIILDGQVLGESPQPVAQVCGLKGNAVRQVTGYAALAKGLHTLSVLETHTTGTDNFRVLWRGPGLPGMQEISSAALSHASETAAPAAPALR